MKKKQFKLAPGEDRTRDLSLTKRTHYHYATEALLIDNLKILINKYISKFKIMTLIHNLLKVNLPLNVYVIL